VKPFDICNLIQFILQLHINFQHSPITKALNFKKEKPSTFLLLLDIFFVRLKSLQKLLLCKFVRLNPNVLAKARRQFHQLSTLSFCTRRSQKRKKIQITWLNSYAFGATCVKAALKYVGEIDSWMITLAFMPISPSPLKEKGGFLNRKFIDFDFVS